VVFWQQQLPPEGSGIPPEQMAWAELTVDLVGADDVQHAIAWAESNIHDRLDEVNRAWAAMHPDAREVRLLIEAGTDLYFCDGCIADLALAVEELGRSTEGA
jgi:hypothetical protein